MVLNGGGLLLYQCYLLLIKYHNKFILSLLKREDSSLLHRDIPCLPEKNVSGWLSSTTLRSEYHHRVVGT